jgi:hypothetical protein
MEHQQADEQNVLACNLGAIDAAERGEHVARAERIFAQVIESRELPTGYGFRLPLETPMLIEIAKWIANEQKCCPFFTFTLVATDQLWLELTGAEAAKEELIAMAKSIGATGTIPDREEWIATHTQEESA